MSAFSSLFGNSSTDKSVETLFSSAGPVDKSLLHQKRTVLDLPPEPIQAEELESEEEESEESEEEVVDKKKEAKKQKKEAKHKEENEGLEAEYFAKLMDEDDQEEKEEKAESESKSESESESEEETKQEKPEPKEKKESAAKSVDLREEELEKAERTVFVGNVSNTVITDKKVYAKFKKLFNDIGPVASIRFRSIAFDEALPRKLAFAKRALHSLRDAANAYVVFKEKTPSRKAPARLNATVFEHHHLRVDHVAHPAPKDNKRTIFVGNLDFEEKEETLWRYFNLHTDNDVELVRVVRDSKTNMGKGFALVTFKDTLSVNKALLLNDKPLTGEQEEKAEKPKKKSRKLRISRAKATAKPSVLSPNHVDNARKARHTKARLTDDQKTKLGRAKALLGKSDKRNAGKVVVEGKRAVKGQRIEGIKGLKGAQGKVKKPRITDRSQRFKKTEK